MAPTHDETPNAPGPRRLVVAAGAEARLDAARRWLAEQPAAVLLVAPARGASDDLARDLGPRLGLHRRTPRQLAAELATNALAREGLSPVGGLGLEALAARALASCLDAEALEYFVPVADTPGMPRALARTLEELRAHGVDAAALVGVSEEADPSAADGGRGRDLARLLRAFESLLESGDLVDFPAIAARAARVDAHPLLGLPTLLLDDAVDSPVEADLLRAVIARSPDALATAVAGDPEAIGRLERVFGTSAESLDEEVNGPLGRLRRGIFSEISEEDDTSEEDAGEESIDRGLVFLSAPGEEREAVEIARRLHDLAREGVRFDECAVAVRDPETYLPLLEEALERAGVPAAFTRGTRRPDPAGRALLALLACAAERLSASRFAEYLSLGQLPHADAAGAPPSVEEVPWVEPEGDQLVFRSLLAAPDEDTNDDAEDEDPDDPLLDPDRPVVAGRLRAPRHWERLLVDAAVIEGRERWRRRLRGVREELRRRRRELEADDPQRRRLEAEIGQLRALERFAVPLVDDLADLPSAAPWGDWLDHLGRLASRALAEPDRVLAVLAELRPMAEVGPVGLDEVRGVLEERLSTLRTEPRGERFGHVLVLTVDELRGRSFHAVFLPGLAEGVFPRRTAEDPLLPDRERRRLDADLPDQDRRVLRERRLLRLAVGAASERLVVSYPSLDTLQGRARVPSFYALDLLRAAEGRLPDLGRLERRAAAEASSRLGWPAPEDPLRAIDDAEYDLAILAALDDRPETGGARYLLETNPRLRRSLRNRYCRWASKITPADGLVLAGDEAGVEGHALGPILERERPSARAFSPTALQHFSACPYRFYLQALVRLRPRDTPEALEQMDPLTRGALFHETQFELLVDLRERGLLPMRERDTETLYTLADGVLDRVAARWQEELAPAIPRVWASEVEGLRIDLRGWVRASIQAGPAWRPDRFELAFGLPLDSAGDSVGDSESEDRHDPASQREDAVVAGGRRLRGSIDVVEVSTPEHPAGEGRVRVTDHKTGRAIQGRRRFLVNGGETLQPLLYALAAERLVEPRGEVVGGRLFYCTRRGGYRSLEVPLDGEGRDAVDVVFETIDRAIASGRLPAAPKKDACKYCDYRQICGPREEARIQRKRPDQLADLERLRRLP